MAVDHISYPVYRSLVMVRLVVVQPSRPGMVAGIGNLAQFGETGQDHGKDQQE